MSYDDYLQNIEQMGKYGFCKRRDDEEMGKYGFVTSGKTDEFNEIYQPKCIEIRDDDGNVRTFDMSRRRFVDKNEETER